MSLSSTVHAIDVTPVTPIVAVLEAIRARHGAPAVHGVTRSLLVDDMTGWQQTRSYVDGSALRLLLASAQRRWPAEPHVAAALAWKSYTYGAVLPAAIGYAAARRIPDLSTANLLVRLHGHDPFIEFGFASAAVTALASDPLSSHSGVTAVESETELLAVMRASLLDDHLLAVLDRIHQAVRVGHRTLLGSIASAVCHVLLRASDVLPGTAVPAAEAILDALGVADLVDFGPDANGRLVVSRRTCCLAFGLPVPKICSGCCIPPTSR